MILPGPLKPRACEAPSIVGRTSRWQEFNARYLADALEIGSTLCLSDELSPGICRHPTGRFCLIMPMRVTIPAGTNAAATDLTPQHQQAAAA